ncbi:MAG: hypothetical protein HYR88_00055 [Verrucomicrobia bacterium]|nr:hypothetical protein [Verrucomicrobiota bacterium]MBI3867472.1 hypothetical protein [Verrucomicrobiota bacterium]
MSSHFDASEFIDDDLQPVRKPGYESAPKSAAAAWTGAARALSREEVEVKVGEMQQRLAELKGEQQRLERERAALEETRRRQSEFTTGRQEMIQNLTRSVAMLEEGEIAHRREAEQRGRALGDMKIALEKVLSLNSEAWDKTNFEVELTRALTTVDNARMEWNSARVKFAELNGDAAQSGRNPEGAGPASPASGIPHGFADLCRLGFAINWPLFLLGLLIFLTLWFRR